MKLTLATEPEIRASLLSALRSRASAQDRLCEEFPLESGRARIDVALIGDQLTGYEIKSDLDTFARFPNQIHAYNRVFDRIYLVCGVTHAEHAIAVLPSCWGVVVARRDERGGLMLQTIREASTNPRQEAFSLASLLWRDEAMAVLESGNQKAPKKASSHSLWEQIATSLPLAYIQQAVLGSLARRPIQSTAAISAM